MSDKKFSEIMLVLLTTILAIAAILSWGEILANYNLIFAIIYGITIIVLYVFFVFTAFKDRKKL